MRAWSHLALIAFTLAGFALWRGPSPALLAVGLAWLGLHLILHQRFFWHYIARDARRWLRRR